MQPTTRGREERCEESFADERRNRTRERAPAVKMLLSRVRLLLHQHNPLASLLRVVRLHGFDRMNSEDDFKIASHTHSRSLDSLPLFLVNSLTHSLSSLSSSTFHISPRKFTKATWMMMMMMSVRTVPQKESTRRPGVLPQRLSMTRRMKQQSLTVGYPSLLISSSAAASVVVVAVVVCSVGFLVFEFPPQQIIYLIRSIVEEISDTDARRDENYVMTVYASTRASS